MFKQLLKKASKSTINSMNKYSQFKYFSSQKENLLNCINSEITHEEKNYQGVAESEKNNFLSNNKFKFIEKANSQLLELHKTHDNWDIKIFYQSRAPMPTEDEGQEEAEPTNMTDFHIIIKPLGRTSGLLVEAMTMDSSINVSQIHCSDHIDAYASDFINGKLKYDQYQGPDFTSLDEKLQGAFVEFLSTLGINDDCGSFIEVTSLDKDQVLYSDWLKKLKNVLL